MTPFDFAQGKYEPKGNAFTLKENASAAKGKPFMACEGALQSGYLSIFAKAYSIYDCIYNR